MGVCQSQRATVYDMIEGDGCMSAKGFQACHMTKGNG